MGDRSSLSPTPFTGFTPGRSSAAATAAVAAIQANAGSIIDRALKAAQRLDLGSSNQQQGFSAAEALEAAAAELPSHTDAAHLICSPIKLTRLSSLRGDQQQQEQREQQEQY